MKQREKDALAREMKEYVRKEVRLGGKHRRHQGPSFGVPLSQHLRSTPRDLVWAHRGRGK